MATITKGATLLFFFSARLARTPDTGAFTVATEAEPVRGLDAAADATPVENSNAAPATAAVITLVVMQTPFSRFETTIRLAHPAKKATMPEHSHSLFEFPTQSRTVWSIATICRIIRSKCPSFDQKR